MALEPMTMKGVTLIFKNFKGEESKYNPPGVRNFGVLLPPDIAEQMAADDWNVKYLKLREEDDPDEPRQAWLPIEAAFHKGRPPVIFLVTEHHRTKLDEEETTQLDWVYIKTNEETGRPMVDLIVNPHRWGDAEKGGVKAYLRSMYITIEEDELEREYGHLPIQ